MVGGSRNGHADGGVSMGSGNASGGGGGGAETMGLYGGNGAINGRGNFGGVGEVAGGHLYGGMGGGGRAPALIAPPILEAGVVVSPL